MKKLHWVTPSLCIGSAPIGGDAYLPNEIQSIRDQGVTDLFSFLTPPEISQLKLEKEAQLCKQNNIVYYNYPIDDFGVPDEDALYVLAQMNSLISSGRKVMIHCLGGIGRSGTMASAYLVLYKNMSALDATNLVSIKRGRVVPETDEQEEFIKQLETVRN